MVDPEGDASTQPFTGVFAQMAYWDNEDQTPNELLTTSFADNSKAGKALQK